MSLSRHGAPPNWPFRVERWPVGHPLRRPQLARRGALVARRPQLVARLRLVDRDRLRGLGDEVDRLALGEVLFERLEPAGRLQALEQLLRRHAALALARGLLDRLEHLLVGRL